ncbi:MAG: GNAT family N-acetyltransferase [Casimicrobiaceae bacterium]
MSVPDAIAIPLAGVLCRGSRVELGWPEEHEFDAMTILRNRPHIRNRFLDPRPLDLVANRTWLRTGMKRPEEGLLAIRLRDNGAFCGMIGWSHWDPAERTIELGRLVVDAARVRRDRAAGRDGYPGIAVDAGTTLRDWAFTHFRLAVMRSVYIGDNAPSARVHRLAHGRVVRSEQVTRRDGSVVCLTRVELRRDEWLALQENAVHD